MAEVMQGDLATKADVKETELRLQAEIERSKADLIRWMFEAMGFQAIILICAAVMIARMFSK